MPSMKHCKRCGETKSTDEFYPSKRYGTQTYCKPCQSERSKDWWVASGRGKYLTLKAEVIAAYGGRCQCPHCDVSDLEFLTIDHVNGDGAEKRRSCHPQGTAFYKWLKVQGYPQDGFQCLCWCCNCAKGQSGQCPHITKHLAAQVAQSDSYPLQLCFDF
jgi:hypothetical protein